MRLLIISHTEHYHHEGRVLGWGATIREIDELASLFTEVRHVAFLHPGPPPSSALPYQRENVQFIPLPPAGGPRLMDKLSILASFPQYARVILKELAAADVVHVRAPANLSLLAMVLLAFRKHPRMRWIKYAGNWHPQGAEAWSYTFQRWWLRKDFARARVTVNGEWPGQPAHIRSFFNPCLTEQERLEAAASTAQKQLETPIRLLFVGRVETAKGVGVVLQTLDRLRQGGLQACLDIIGDGPERPAFQRIAASLGLGDSVCFHGWVPRTGMGSFYSAAHFILLPSTASEGWPKVLSEAMAYGVVPVASNVSSIGQYLRRFSLGRSLYAENVDGFAEALQAYLNDPEQWQAESERGREAAASFTYDIYLRTVKELLDLA